MTTVQFGNWEEADAWFKRWRESRDLTGAELLQTLIDYTKWSKSVETREGTATADDAVRVVLNIMQRNEATLLPRCLASVLPVVDGIVISNTHAAAGPLVDTSLVQAAEVVPAHVPLSIETEQFVNFGKSRTAGLRHAQRAIARWGWDAQRTYILLMDADMVLVVRPDFVKAKLCEVDQHVVEQQNGALRYFNTRLLRASLLWTCVGATHEYYDGPPGHTQSKLYTLWMDDRNDGCNKSDKYDRDERLLLEDLQENPRNVRSMFYLGQTYQHRARDDDDLRQAIAYYTQHNEVGSFEEENWYALYCIGHCWKALKDWPKALDAYLQAYDRRPWRVEPLLEIITHYRSAGKNHAAKMLLDKVMTIAFPSNDILFIDTPCYGYKRDFEQSILGYYTGNKTEALVASDKLLRNPAAPYHIREQTYRNMKFYLEPASKRAAQRHKLGVHPYNLPSDWNLCNPSVAVLDTRLVVLIRTVNYKQTGARHYTFPDPSDHTVRTRNIIQVLRSPDTVESERKVVFDSGPYASDSRVLGVEDMRLYVHNDELCYTATCLECKPNHQPLIVRGKVNQPSFVPLVGYHDDQCQKNWLPFVDDDNVAKWVYGYNPLTVVTADAEGRVTVVSQHDWSSSGILTANYRGSAGPVDYGTDRLLLIHEVCVEKDGTRVYLHRWVVTSRDFSQLRSVSRPFSLDHSGVEMALGMVWYNGQLVVSVGVEDREAWLYYFDKDTLATFF